MTRRESQFVGGAPTAAAPPAGTVLAQVNVPSDGYWNLTATVALTGANDVPNKVAVNIPNRGTIIVPFAANAGSVEVPISLKSLWLVSTQTVTMFMSLAGGAAAVYQGWLQLDPAD